MQIAMAEINQLEACAMLPASSSSLATWLVWSSVTLWLSSSLKVCGRRVLHDIGQPQVPMPKAQSLLSTCQCSEDLYMAHICLSGLGQASKRP